MTIKTVGLIGAGLMGHGIGKNVVEKGFALNVMGHRKREPIDDLVARGARETKTPAETARQSDLVILCVTGTPQIEEIVYGADGILSSGKKGLIVADCSTAVPDSTIKISADCAKKDITFIDTPMTRTPKEAEAGKLGLMIAGPKAVTDSIMPVLQCFADLIVHTGEVGTAHQVKLINNFLSLGNAALAAEAITVATKAKVDMNALKEIIMGGGGASVMFGRLINVPLHDDDSHAKFAISNARKDMRYYTNMTETMPVATPLAEAVHQTYVLAANQGYSERFVPRLIDMLVKLNNAKA